MSAAQKAYLALALPASVTKVGLAFRFIARQPGVTDSGANLGALLSSETSYQSMQIFGKRGPPVTLWAAPWDSNADVRGEERELGPFSNPLPPIEKFITSVLMVFTAPNSVQVTSQVAGSAVTVKSFTVAKAPKEVRVGVVRGSDPAQASEIDFDDVVVDWQ
jgi:hypothetical protein